MNTEDKKFVSDWLKKTNALIEDALSWRKVVEVNMKRARKYRKRDGDKTCGDFLRGKRTKVEKQQLKEFIKFKEIMAKDGEKYGLDEVNLEFLL